MVSFVVVSSKMRIMPLVRHQSNEIASMGIVKKAALEIKFGEDGSVPSRHSCYDSLGRRFDVLTLPLLAPFCFRVSLA